MADSNITDEQEAHSRLVLYQVSLGLALVAINHRAIQVALPTLTQVFRADLSFIQWVLLVYDLAVIGLVLTLERRTRAIYKCLQFYRAFYQCLRSPGDFVLATARRE